MTSQLFIIIILMIKLVIIEECMGEKNTNASLKIKEGR